MLFIQMLAQAMLRIPNSVGAQDSKVSKVLPTIPPTERQWLTLGYGAPQKPGSTTMYSLSGVDATPSSCNYNFS
jgi:hypothetical protein